jgi:exo-beta-1,3-glucanase (GH17 family)
MSEFSYDSLKNVPALKHLPILTLDQLWYQLLPESGKTEEIKYWERQVNELLKKQGQVTNDLEEVKNIKGRLMRGVVANMEDNDNSSHYRKLMNKSQQLIYEAKDKIFDLEKEADTIPEQLQRANQQLMIETIKVCYERINTNNEDIQVLSEWIDSTRVKLKKKLLIKQDKEVVNNQLYSCMHDLLGREVMGELDRLNDD